MLARRVDRIEMNDLLGPDGYPIPGDQHVILHGVPE